MKAGRQKVFDLTPLLEGGELKPHEISKPKRIRMHMVVLDPLRPNGPVAVFSLADFTSRVLVGSITGPTADKPGIGTSDRNAPGDDPDSEHP
jgi:hypothetical protein